MNPLRHNLRALRHDDAGVTLAEMTVTTAIMSVVMAIFTTGVVQLFQASNNNELAALTRAQLNTAFLRLDRNLRYAAGIGPVHDDAAGNVYVEYLNTETADGKPECAQLQLNKADKVLRRRVWVQTTAPPARWVILASEIVVRATPDDPGDPPTSAFELVEPTAQTGYQRLRIILVVATNPGPAQTEATTDITFTALNSTRKIEAATICKEARP